MFASSGSMAREAIGQSFGPNSGFLSARDPAADNGAVWSPPSATTSFLSADGDDGSGVMVLSMPTTDFRPVPITPPTEALQRHRLADRLGGQGDPQPQPQPQPRRQAAHPQGPPAAPETDPYRRAARKTGNAAPPPSDASSQTMLYIAAAVLGGLLLVALVGSVLARCGVLSFGRQEPGQIQARVVPVRTEAVREMEAMPAPRGTIGWAWA